MLKNVRVQRFRRFEDYRIEDLNRVSLFVGKNNCGKTTILEILELIYRRNEAEALAHSVIRRKEFVIGDFAVPGPVLDFSHLFSCHILEPGASFQIEATGEGDVLLRCEVDSESDSEARLAAESDKILGVHLEVVEDGKSVQHLYPMPHGRTYYEQELILASGLQDRTDAERSYWLSSSAVPINLSRLWNSIALTSHESELVRALQLVEPLVERIAFLSLPRWSIETLPPPMNVLEHDLKTNVIVKLKSISDPVPLGSLGEGVTRILLLAILLVKSAGAALFVDEIDTGFHRTVMDDLWRMVAETAQRLDVQVFATTHSLDCVRSLSLLRARHPEVDVDVSVHRIEPEMNHTVRYDTEALEIAAQHRMDVR